MSLLATTEADRGPRSRSASSPKYCPGPSLARRRRAGASAAADAVQGLAGQPLGPLRQPGLGRLPASTVGGDEVGEVVIELLRIADELVLAVLEAPCPPQHRDPFLVGELQ